MIQCIGAAAGTYVTCRFVKVVLSLTQLDQTQATAPAGAPTAPAGAPTAPTAPTGLTAAAPAGAAKGAEAKKRGKVGHGRGLRFIALGLPQGSERSCRFVLEHRCTSLNLARPRRTLATRPLMRHRRRRATVCGGGCRRSARWVCHWA